MTRPAAVDAHNRPQTPLETRYEEDSIQLDAPGCRVTVFVQTTPDLAYSLNVPQLERICKIMDIVLQARRLKGIIR